MGSQTIYIVEEREDYEQKKVVSCHRTLAGALAAHKAAAENHESRWGEVDPVEPQAPYPGQHARCRVGAFTYVVVEGELRD